MKFEWDEHKNNLNLKKHGISFQEAQTIFDGDVFNWIDDRFDYGEIRETSIGAIQGGGNYCCRSHRKRWRNQNYFSEKGNSNRKRGIL